MQQIPCPNEVIKKSYLQFKKDSEQWVSYIQKELTKYGFKIESTRIFDTNDYNVKYGMEIEVFMIDYYIRFSKNGKMIGHHFVLMSDKEKHRADEYIEEPYTERGVPPFSRQQKYFYICPSNKVEKITDRAFEDNRYSKGMPISKWKSIIKKIVEKNHIKVGSNEMSEILQTIPSKEDRATVSQILGFPLSDLSKMHQVLSKMGFDPQFDWDRKLSKWWYNNNGRSALYFDYDNNLDQLKHINIQIVFEKGKVAVSFNGDGLATYSYELTNDEDKGLHFNLSSIKQINSNLISKASKEIYAKAHKYWTEWNEVQRKLASKSTSLRNKIIRLAYQNPSLRKDLLPLVTKYDK